MLSTIDRESLSFFNFNVNKENRHPTLSQDAGPFIYHRHCPNSGIQIQTHHHLT